MSAYLAARISLAANAKAAYYARILCCREHAAAARHCAFLDGAALPLAGACALPPPVPSACAYVTPPRIHAALRRAANLRAPPCWLPPPCPSSPPTCRTAAVACAPLLPHRARLFGCYTRCWFSHTHTTTPYLVTHTHFGCTHSCVCTAHTHTVLVHCTHTLQFSSLVTRIILDLHVHVLRLRLRLVTFVCYVCC